MKAYRITIMSLREGTCYVWASSLRKVKQRARELLDAIDEVDAIFEKPERIEVTPDWLHHNFNRDNG